MRASLLTAFKGKAPLYDGADQVFCLTRIPSSGVPVNESAFCSLCTQLSEDLGDQIVHEFQESKPKSYL